MFEKVNEGYGYTDFEPLAADDVHGWTRVTLNDNEGDDEFDYAMLGETGKSVRLTREEAEWMLAGTWYPNPEDAI